MPLINKLIRLITIVVMISGSIISGCERQHQGVWSIRGYVQNSSGKPISGAQVHASNGEGQQIWVDGPHKTIPWKRLVEPPLVLPYLLFKPVKTDVSGNFKIYLNAPVGGFVLVRHPDYLERQVAIDRKSMKLNASSTIDIGIIKLEEGASVSGTVIDYNGKPADHAQVAIYHNRELDVYNGPFACTAFVRLTKTDDRGAFIIKGLPISQYHIAAWDTQSLPCAKEIDIKKDGSPATVNFVLEKGRSVKVIAQNRVDGSPMPDCQVQIKSLTGEYLNEPFADAKVTDRFGVATFTGLKQEKYFIVVIPPDQRRNIGYLNPYPPFSPWCHFQPAPSLGGNEEVIVVKVDPAITLKGKIIDANTSKPIQRFRLFAFPDNRTFNKEYRGQYGSPHEIWGAANTFSPNGEFTLEGFRAGIWMIEVVAYGYNRQGFPVEIPVGGFKEPIQFNLKPATGQIAGTVIDDETGKPMEGIQVRAYEWDSRLSDGVNDQRTLTKADGSFAFNNLLGDEFHLTVMAEKAGYLMTKIKFKPPQRRPAVLEPLRLQRVGILCTLKGRFLNAQGKPVAKAKVVLARGKRHGYPKNPEYYTITKDDGAFEINNITKGEYTILYWDKTKPITFSTAGITITVTLRENN